MTFNQYCADQPDLRLWKRAEGLEMEDCGNLRKTMKELRQDRQPYEKCLESGPGILSDAELLAVILRAGYKNCTSVELAEKILDLCPYQKGLTGILHLSIKELRSLKGIGPVKAVQIGCIGELSRRISAGSAREQLCFDAPESIADYYMESLRHEEQENVICMMLDTKEHYLGDTVITRGTVNISLISPRELFLAALSYHAVQIVLVHNHPSGDPHPSRDDILATKRISEAGNLLGITLLDHIVIGDRKFVSLRREGYF